MRSLSSLIVPLTIIVAAVGLLDALVRRNLDLVALFALILALQIGMLLSSSTNRTTVTIRPDLARWARERSQRTGEPVDDVIDRSVPLLQHRLYQSSPPDGG